MQKVVNKIDRLHKLHKTDLGFYVLALHSFIEFYIKEVTNRDERNFYHNLEMFNRYLKRNNKTAMNFRFIRELSDDHYNTNMVRHNFENIYSKEAETATYRFIKFLKKTDIKPNLYESLQELYKRWDSRTNNTSDESKELQIKLNEARDNIQKLEKDLSEHRLIKKDLDLLHSENILLNSKIEAGKGDRELLLEDKKALEESIKELEGSKAGIKAMENYIHYLSRFSLYTRTRADYERSVLRLSTDQKRAIDRISLKKDFLIKGAAGTGKSLVLIKAIEKVIELHSLGAELINGQVLLLSFSKTLSKYNQYVANLLDSGLERESINTVDSFILSKFKTIFPEYTLDVSAKVSLPGVGTSKLSLKDLKVEIEDFILSGFVKREEYCLKGGIPRKGMKVKPLKLGDREEVFEAFDEYIEYLEEEKVVNFKYLRYKLLKYLKENPDDREIRDISYMFVDEVQDMTPCSLAILKELTTGPIIMAGDDNQKIFAATSPYKRSGINIQGSSVILRENFRNTNQIINFANKILGKDINAVDLVESFRDGPEPEVYRGKSRSKDLIDKLKVYHEDLGYELHNIAIIVPSVNAGGVNSLIKKVNREGYETTIVDKDFDFSNKGSIRVTTLQRCKGLDFPVVLLYLPFVTRLKGFDDETLDEMERNLLYVACTRAMDNLDLFIGDKPKGILEDI